MRRSNASSEIGLGVAIHIASHIFKSKVCGGIFAILLVGNPLSLNLVAVIKQFLNYILILIPMERRTE
jgi:hypothetical protein